MSPLSHHIVVVTTKANLVTMAESNSIRVELEMKSADEARGADFTKSKSAQNSVDIHHFRACDAYSKVGLWPLNVLWIASSVSQVASDLKQDHSR